MMKRLIKLICFALIMAMPLASGQEQPHDFATYLQRSGLQIPNTFSPFGNSLENSRFGDDGSRCITDPSGVLTWVDSQGTVRLLPNTELAVPMFVSDTECVVWNNCFADYADIYSRPLAEIIIFKSIAGSSAVTSQAVDTRGTEVVPTSLITTTTGTFNFVTLRRRPGEPAISDDVSTRVYRLTFNGNVQLLKLREDQIPEDERSPVPQRVLGHGSDNSILVEVGGDALRRYFWIDQQGRIVEIDPADTEIDYAVFVSNTKLVYEIADGGGFAELNRNPNDGEIVGGETPLAGVQGSALTSLPYFRQGDNVYFYTVEAPNLVRTYQLLENGISPVVREHTLDINVNEGTVVATTNANDGAALIYSNTSSVSWLHEGDTLTTNNFTTLPNSNLALPLYVTDEQCVLWSNARAPVNDNGTIPDALLIHHLRDTTLPPPALTDTEIFVDGKTILNVAPSTPNFPYWLITTAEKTTPDTSILRTYRLTSPLTTDRDNDGLIDAFETNTGTFVSATDTGSSPTNPDTDGDGRLDGDEVYPFVMIDGAFTWEQARADAVLRGGQLATITSATEDAGMQIKFTNDDFFPKWLGATDAAFEDPIDHDDFEWITGESFDPVFAASKWAPGQPDDLQDSDGLLMLGDFNWADAQLSDTYGYLLEYAISDPNVADTDGDGLTDGEEIEFRTDPTVADTDGDGLDDLVEFNLDSNPLLVDSDGDGLDDSDEFLLYGTSLVLVDTDSDGLSDFEEVTGGSGSDPNLSDTDGDGYTDYEELSAIPPSDPTDPTSFPSRGQLTSPNPSMHDQVEFIKTQPGVDIPLSFAPFGNRTDNNRYGDDGSAIVLDVNGVLIWQGADGQYRTIPDSEFATPLFVSSSEAIVWVNSLDPARINAEAGAPEANLQVAIYRIDPDSGEIDTPTLVEILGDDILPTAPITTSSEAFTLVTFDHQTQFIEDQSITRASIYRLTYSGAAQLISEIDIPNYDNRVEAALATRALGHGSDGAVLFSIDPDAFFAENSNEPFADLNFAGVNLIRARHRRIFLVNGSIPGPSAIVNELSASTRIVNFGDGSLPARAIYTSQNRVVYQTTSNSEIKDATINPFSGALFSDDAIALPPNFGSILSMTTHTVVGDERWIYATSEDGESLNVYRLDTTGLDLLYTAEIPIGFDVNQASYVTKVNPLDGSAVVKTINGNMLWLVNNQAPGIQLNAVGIPNSANSKALFVHRDELVLWGNARDRLDGGGQLNDVQVRHYEQQDGLLVNPTGSFSSLSFNLDGKYILNPPPFTPDFSKWYITTLEKSAPMSVQFRYYRLNSFNLLDTDSDSLPDRLEASSGTGALISDTDGDGLSDSEELYPYYVVSGSYTWEQAKADALARGGRLAIIRNRDDYTALKRRFSSFLISDLWLGATDELAEGNWVNLDGTQFNLTNWLLPSPVLDWSDYYESDIETRISWRLGSPDNVNNADGLVLNSQFRFIDRPQSERLGYLIEYPRTNPDNNDSDNDGVLDGKEISNGTDPAVRNPFSGVSDITPGDNNSGSLTVPFGAAGLSTTYEGLWFDPEQGHVYRQILKLSRSGKFSSKVYGIALGLGGKLKGSFGDNGYYLKAAPKGMKNIVTMEMQLYEEAPGEWIIIGRAQTSANRIIGVELRPSQYGKVLPCPYQGTYSMQLVNLNAGSVGPRGDGVAVVFVYRKGKAKMKVFLPDGLRASYMGSIVSNDLLALRMLTRRGQSAVIGPMKFGSQKVDRDIEGSVRFVSGGQTQGGQYPGGFDQTRDVNGCLYTPPTRGFLPIDSIPNYQYNTVINFLGGDLGGVAEAASWNAKNKIILPVRPDRRANFKVGKKTGLIKYTYKTLDIINGINNINARGYAIPHQKSGQITGYYDNRVSNGLITLAANDGTLPEITIVNPRTMSIDKSAKVYNVSVQTSGPWGFVLPEELIVDTDSGEVAWATVEIISGNYVIDPGDATTPPTISDVIGDGNGTIRITVLENDTFAQRQAYIEIAGVRHHLKQDYR